MDELTEHGILETARAVMESHWRSPGFTCPNADTYPWMWHWDSCFHSLIWARLGEADRAVSELACALSGIESSGFVPHLVYFDGSDAHVGLWGRHGTSSITQPPVHGHVIAELHRRGIGVPEEVIDRSVRGLRFLLDVRGRSPSGLALMVHPWESGCDHSPRWDDLFNPGGRHGEGVDTQLWFDRKGEMVESIEYKGGAPVANSRFEVASVAFNSILAFSAAELGVLTCDDELIAGASRLAEALMSRWSSDLSTWVDEGDTAGGSAGGSDGGSGGGSDGGSGSIRTLEALLPLLVCDDETAIGEACDQLSDGRAFLGTFGLRQVDAAEASYDPSGYWRGPSWPQLNYLIGIALDRVGRGSLAQHVRNISLRGALRAGFSEYWDADSAQPGGASPQSWSCLVTVDM